ncbi:MAG: DMT family transporter [Halorientalis sp.]
MTSRRTLASFLLASLFFGGTYVAVKAGGAYFPPLLFVAFRYDIAAVLLLGVVALTRSGEDLYPTSRRDVAGVLATAVFAIGLANALLFLGQQSTTSAVGSIIFGLAPILTPVFAALLLADEGLSRHGAVGTALGLVGVALVVDPDPAMLAGGANLGLVLLLGGAVSSALGVVLIRRADGSLGSVVQTAWALPVSALMLHVASSVAGESVGAVVWSPTALLTLSYLSVFAGALAYVAYFGLVSEVGATRSSLVFYASPVVATLGGWALLGESISATTVAGFGVIVVGFAVIGAETLAAAVTSLVSTRPADGESDGAQSAVSRGYPAEQD